MWFNNLIVYKYILDEKVDWQEALKPDILKPCPAHARFIFGWVPSFADELVHEVAGTTMICMGKEERLLPRGVIQRVLEERVKEIEVREGRTIKRNERSQMMEDVEFDLLPKSFCVQKKLHAILDTNQQRIFINTSSTNQANQLTALLKKSIAGIRFEPCFQIDNTSAYFSEWINNPQSLPANMSLAADCQLFDRADEKKKVNCKGYELPADEVLSLLAQGLTPSEISVHWNDQVQFSLTQECVFKKMKCLDYLVDEFNEIRNLDEEYQQQDAALLLLGTALREMTNNLLDYFAKNKKDLLEAAAV